MENRLNKSGLKLCIGLLTMMMLVSTGSSYAVSSFKNTPLYRHVVKRRNSQPVRLYEKEPADSTKQAVVAEKFGQERIEVKEKGNQARVTTAIDPEKAVGNRILRNRPANLMDPATFTPQMPFSQAVEILRNSTSPKLNIVVLWKDLEEKADIYPDTPIGIDGVSGVPLSRHLKSLLDGVSGGSPEKLGYVVDGGVIVIATLDSLPQRMVTRVYDITDLVGQPSTGFPQFGFGMPGMGMPGMMGMGMPGTMGMGMPGMGMQGMGMGFGIPGMGMGYGMPGSMMMPGLGGIIGSMTPGLGTGYGTPGTGYGTSLGFGGVRY